MSSIRPSTTSSLSLDGSNIPALVATMRAGVEIKDRKYHLATYKQVFLGSDGVNWLLSEGHASSSEDACDIGDLMISQGFLHHATRDHSFKNENLFYRFASDEPSHGKKGVTPITGEELSWKHLSEGIFPTASVNTLQSNLNEVVSRDIAMEQASIDIGVSPLDQYNTELLDNVHPPSWVDPVCNSDKVYNLVVLGAGSGGLVSAAGAAGVYAKVAIIECHLMGGDCLNVGCVPSKALIKAASVAHTLKNCNEYGISIEGTVKIDFGKVMERMRRLRAGISHHDSTQRFSKELGIDVFIGRGAFTSSNTICVNGATLTFKKAVIATGGTAALPPIQGLKDAPYLTNSSIFNLTELPARMIVIGAGSIGIELAQAMARFGCNVTVLVRSDRILPKEDPDAAKVILDSLISDGVTIVYNVTFTCIEHTPPTEYQTFPTIRVVTEQQIAASTNESATGESTSTTTTTPSTGSSDTSTITIVYECEALLIAAGRKPSVSNIGLEAAGVKYSLTEGVTVTDTLQTSNRLIYAVGDCCTKYQFTHVSDFMARLVIRNALFFGNGKFSDLLIPWCTYTEPEVAHVGLYPRDCNERGIPYTTYSKSFSSVDRAVLEGSCSTSGFVKVHVKEGTDTIIGATIVGPNAGDMISELSVAMQHKIGLGLLSGVIHPYPTKAEAIRQTGDLYNKTRLTPTVKALFRNLMKLQRA